MGSTVKNNFALSSIYHAGNFFLATCSCCCWKIARDRRTEGHDPLCRRVVASRDGIESPRENSKHQAETLTTYGPPTTYLFRPFLPEVGIVERDVISGAGGGESGFGEGGAFDAGLHGDHLSPALQYLVDVFLAKLVGRLLVIHDSTVSALEGESGKNWMCHQ